MNLKNQMITVGELLDNPKSRAVLQKRLPKLVNHPMIGLVRNLTMREILSQSNSYIPQAMVQAVVRELENA